MDSLEAEARIMEFFAADETTTYGLRRYEFPLFTSAPPCEESQ